MVDRKAPVVAVQVWYGVGSRDERPGMTGASHLLEHMMFQGSSRFGPGEFDRQLVSRGGQNNAFTTTDFTAYHEVLASEHLETALALEADRMKGALLPAEKLLAEREVVKEELRGSSDSALGMAWDYLPAAMWLANGYHWPVGGWPGDLDAISRADLLAYYRTYYQPNNATLVVVGDLDPQRALRSIRRVFDKLAPGPTPPRRYTREPSHRGERRIEVIRPVQAPVVLTAFRLPGAGHRDIDAARLLALVLGEGRSARLQAALVGARKPLRELEVGVDEAREGGFLYFALAPGPGHSPLDAERALERELAVFKRFGATREELNRARRQAETRHLLAIETVEGRAEDIGRRVLLTGTAQRTDFTARLRGITETQLRALAGRYFSRANRATVTVRPVDREDL